MFVMDASTIKTMPKDHMVIKSWEVLDFRLQKPDPNRLLITAGGNLIYYLVELTTYRTDLATSKIIWNSVLIT